MKSLLSQLDDDQAVLLMYLAGELSSADVQAVEKRLATDAALRAELDRLGSLEEQVAGTMAMLRDSEPALERRSIAVVRRVGAVMRQWQVTRHTQRARDEQDALRMRKPGRRIPTWIYPVAAVLMVAVGAPIWWLKSLEVQTIAIRPADPIERPAPQVIEPPPQVAVAPYTSMYDFFGVTDPAPTLSGEVQLADELERSLGDDVELVRVDALPYPVGLQCA
jgi:hypothetical protein